MAEAHARANGEALVVKSDWACLLPLLVATEVRQTIAKKFILFGLVGNGNTNVRITLSAAQAVAILQLYHTGMMDGSNWDGFTQSVMRRMLEDLEAML